MAPGVKKDKNRTADVCSNPACLKLGIVQPIEEFGWKSKVKGLHNSQCKTCHAAYEKTPKRKASKAAYEKTPKGREVRAKITKTHEQTPKRKASKAAYSKTPKYKTIKKTYKNNNQEKVRASNTAYRKNNPGKINAYAAQYRAIKLQRTPKWAESEKEPIRMFYENCPEGMEVDHDFPLQGKYVSGLHVLSNLRYLTINDNRKKGRKFDPIEFNKLDKNIKE